MPLATPPRLDTVNEQLLDRAIRHAHAIERYKAGEVRRIVRVLDEKVLPDLHAKLQARLERARLRGFDSSSRQTQRYRDLIAAIDEEVRVGVATLVSEAKPALYLLARHEAEWLVETIRTVVPVEIDLLAPSPQLLRSVVTSRPFQGRLLRQWWGSVSSATRARLREQLEIGISAGESVPSITSRFRKVTDVARRNVEAVVRTAVNHVTTHATSAVAEANRDIVKGEQVVATLDHRTTVICASLDGKVFPVGEGERSPFHVNCRTRMITVLKSWKELGIDLKEAPPGTRASMDGQVPGKWTYQDWLRRQPRAVQDEVLGPGRARIFRAGRVKLDRFVDNRLRPLSLEELRALDRRALQPN